MVKRVVFSGVLVIAFLLQVITEAQEISALNNGETYTNVKIYEKTKWFVRVVYDICDRRGPFKMVYNFADPMAEELITIEKNDSILFNAKSAENQVLFEFDKQNVTFNTNSQEGDIIIANKNDFIMSFPVEGKMTITVTQKCDYGGGECIIIGNDGMRNILSRNGSGAKRGFKVLLNFTGDECEYFNVAFYIVSNPRREEAEKLSCPVITHKTDGNLVYYLNIGAEEENVQPIIKDSDMNVRIVDKKKILPMSIESVAVKSGEKLFLWDGLDNLKPLSYAVEIE